MLRAVGTGEGFADPDADSAAFGFERAERFECP
jgi:hypothetical protein